jgi:hypothetical protein
LHINRIKDKNYIIISREAENILGKTPLIIKPLKILGIEVSYLNIIKTIYDRPIANIILNDEKQKAFPLKSGKRQNITVSLLLFNRCLNS